MQRELTTETSPEMKKRFSLAPSELRVLLIGGDVFFLFVALLVAFGLWAFLYGHTFNVDFIRMRASWFFLPGVWLFVAAVGGVYHQEAIGSFQKSFRELLKCGLAIVTLYVFIYFVLPPSSLARGVVVYHAGTSFLLLSGWRHLFLTLAWSPSFRRRCIILGDEDEVHAIATFLANYRFFDVLSSSNTHGTVLFADEYKPPVSHIDVQEVDAIIVGETADLCRETRESLIKYREWGVSIIPFPKLYERLTRRVPVHFIGKRGWPLVLLNGDKANGFYPVVKRLVDVAGAALGLLGFGLLFPWIAAAIKLDSPGPTFYRQVRVGKGGKTFVVWKLRTMAADAEKEEELWSNHKDHRVTRVGRWLRRMRLDEFPQCWNILKGEMSILGPRPERLKVVQKLEEELPFYRLRHIVKPGMAGWAMVNRSYMCSYEDAKARLEYDLYYIKNQSLWFDSMIFLRAFAQLFMMKGT